MAKKETFLNQVSAISVLISSVLITTIFNNYFQLEGAFALGSIILVPIVMIAIQSISIEYIGNSDRQRDFILIFYFLIIATVSWFYFFGTNKSIDDNNPKIIKNTQIEDKHKEYNKIVDEPKIQQVVEKTDNDIKEESKVVVENKKSESTFESSKQKKLDDYEQMKKELEDEFEKFSK
jgi:hypothetical protein